MSLEMVETVAAMRTTVHSLSSCGGQRTYSYRVLPTSSNAISVSNAEAAR